MDLSRIIVVFTLVAATIGTTGSMEGFEDPTGEESSMYDDVVNYTINMTNIQQSFNQTNQVELIVPNGTILVTGEQYQIRNGNNWSEILPNGTTVFHESPSIPVWGDIVDGEKGHARLLLGKYGVYGDVTTSDAHYSFDPLYNSTTDSFEQQAFVVYESSSFLIVNNCTVPPVDQGCDWPCPPEQSYVQIDVEQSVRDDYPNWVEHFEAALTRHHGSWEMWKDVCIELLIQDGVPRAVPDISTHTNVREALNAYASWLRDSSYNNITESSAYQLFTNRDLFGCPDPDQISCPGDENNKFIGYAFVDEVVAEPTSSNRFAQSQSVSIVEAKHYRGSYDPEDTWDLARVAGHELSHTYGESDHQSDCKSLTRCNIMKSSFSWRVKTYWTDWSRCEVYQRFYDEDDYAGPPQPCTNWYAP